MSLSRRIAARELLALLPTTIPKKYRERLQDISKGYEGTSWALLIEELKHKSNLAAEIDQIVEAEQRVVDEWEEIKKDKEEQEIKRLAEEHIEEEIKKEKDEQEKEEQERIIADLLFGKMEYYVEPRNIQKYSFCDYSSSSGSNDGECR